MRKKAIIQVQPDCGNAPRKLFLKDLNIAIANGDIDFLMANIPEEISWNIVGQKSNSGKKHFFTELSQHKIREVKKLILDTLITHGPEASVSGQAILEDNTKVSFCNIYRFTRAGGSTLKSVTSFIIEH